MLDEPEQRYVSSLNPSRAAQRLSSGPGEGIRLRRDLGEDFAGGFGVAEDNDDRRQEKCGARPSGPFSKLRTRLLPKSLAARIATGMMLLAIAGAGIALLMVTRSFLLHDERFIIQSPSSIEIEGNHHVTRAQLLDIFGEDVGRNIFRISLTKRQADLEALAWVQHASVMRLLPGRIRLSIVEREPIAFVRQGSHIGLVDGNGVLLDMSKDGAGSQAKPHYSFPVVTGIFAADPASTRAARIKIFQRFTADLDSAGEKVSEILSEVDLSNPEDVKALIPDHSAEILVHFGDDHFLERYRKFQELLPQWHTQFPNLASVDMRYEREVVLDMANSAGPTTDTPSNASSPAAVEKQALNRSTPEAAHAVATHHAPAARKLPAREAPLKMKPPSSLKRVVLGRLKRFVVTKRTRSVAGPRVKPVQRSASSTVASPASSTVSAAKPASQPSSGSAAARSSFHVNSSSGKSTAGKPAAGRPLFPRDSYQDTYHPPQVAPR